MNNQFLLIKNADIYTPETVIQQGALKIEQGKITAIYTKEEAERLSLSETRIIDATGKHLIPGFIDVHVHGGGGADFMHVDHSLHETICGYHARWGTTSLLATTVTDSPEKSLLSL